MSPGEIGHVTHNLILIITYITLGTLYLPDFVRRLDIPERVRKLFTASVSVFFLVCATTHVELLLHIRELPPEFFTLSHNVLGFLQAAGALGFVWVLRPLILGESSNES